jgi:hypothetical protein
LKMTSVILRVTVVILRMTAVMFKMTAVILTVTPGILPRRAHSMARMILPKAPPRSNAL